MLWPARVSEGKKDCTSAGCCQHLAKHLLFSRAAVTDRVCSKRAVCLGDSGEGEGKCLQTYCQISEKKRQLVSGLRKHHMQLIQPRVSLKAYQVERRGKHYPAKGHSKQKEVCCQHFHLKSSSAALSFCLLKNNFFLLYYYFCFLTKHNFKD